MGDSNSVKRSYFVALGGKSAQNTQRIRSKCAVNTEKAFRVVNSQNIFSKFLEKTGLTFVIFVANNWRVFFVGSTLSELAEEKMTEIIIPNNETGMKVFINGEPDLSLVPDAIMDCFITALLEKVQEAVAQESTDGVL